MADTKITALTALTGADPANDVIPIVDVSDTTMAASGTTKKISVNNILGASGTATLASATITGDLTVDTSTLKVDSANNRVGVVYATPATALDVNGDITQRNGSGTIIGNIQNSSGLYDVKASANVTGLQLSTAAATPIIFALNNVEAMRLNATGLGVGAVPSFEKLVIQSASDCIFSLKKTGGLDAFYVKTDGTTGWLGSSAGSTGNKIGFNLKCPDSSLLLDISGNVGIGVTPSAWLAAVKALDIGSNALAAYSGGITHNAYFDNTDSRWEYKGTGAAAFYSVQGGAHAWYIAASGTANNPITTFSSAAMTLDASGNLLVGTTSSPSGTKVGAIAKLSSVSAEGTAAINVSTTPVAISRNTGVCGLFFVMGYNASGGAQGWYLVASTGSGTPTVISSGGTPGLTLTFTMAGGQLNAQTASGTFVANAFSITA